MRADRCPLHTLGGDASGRQTEIESQNMVISTQLMFDLRAREWPGGKKRQPDWDEADRRRDQRALLDDLAQPLAVGAARHQPGAVAQDDRVLAVEPGFEALDGIDIDDRRAMHAQEAVGIEALLEVLEGVAKEVLLPAGVDLDVVAGSLEPLDVGDAHEVHGLAAADGDATLRAPLGADRCEKRKDLRVRGRSIQLL